MKHSSGVKRVIKRLVPPVLVDLLYGRSLFPAPEMTWEGMYPHLTAVPVTPSQYDSEIRVAEFVHRTRSALAFASTGQFISSEWHHLLSLLAAFVSRDNKTIRILDFGGGVGFAFAELIGTLRSKCAIKYHVVELKKMCDAGRKLFADDSRIQFHTTMPPLHNKLDIVYASSVLPYVEDYSGVLRSLAALNAPYLLLTQLAAGGFPTYAAKQLNLSQQIFRYWFLNIEELVGIVVASGYNLAYESQAGPKYDQSNYPEEYRIGQMRNLLFTRSEQDAPTELFS